MQHAQSVTSVAGSGGATAAGTGMGSVSSLRSNESAGSRGKQPQPLRSVWSAAAETSSEEEPDDDDEEEEVNEEQGAARPASGSGSTGSRKGAVLGAGVGVLAAANEAANAASEAAVHSSDDGVDDGDDEDDDDDDEDEEDDDRNVVSQERIRPEGPSGGTPHAVDEEANIASSGQPPRRGAAVALNDVNTLTAGANMLQSGTSQSTMLHHMHAADSGSSRILLPVPSAGPVPEAPHAKPLAGVPVPPAHSMVSESAPAAMDAANKNRSATPPPAPGLLQRMARGSAMSLGLRRSSLGLGLTATSLSAVDETQGGGAGGLASGKGASQRGARLAHVLTEEGHVRPGAGPAPALGATVRDSNRSVVNLLPAFARRITRETPVVGGNKPPPPVGQGNRPDTRPFNGARPTARTS